MLRRVSARQQRQPHGDPGHNAVPDDLPDRYDVVDDDDLPIGLSYDPSDLVRLDLLRGLPDRFVGPPKQCGSVSDELLDRLHAKLDQPVAVRWRLRWLFPNADRKQLLWRVRA